MVKYWMRAAAIAAALLMTFVAVPSRADTPDPAVQRIQGFCDVWIDVMKHAKELGVKGRYEKLKPATDQIFGYGEMVRYIVGSDRWSKTPPADQQKLVATFARYTAAVWADRLDGYDGEKFVIQPAPTPRGQDRVVMTKLVGPNDSTDIAFRMRQLDGSWKIVDVYYMNSVSQLGTEHDGDSATVQSSGVAGLEKAMDAKTVKLLK